MVSFVSQEGHEGCFLEGLAMVLLNSCLKKRHFVKYQ